MKYQHLFPAHKYSWLPILYSKILTIKPKRIIEYGTGEGGTAIVMGLALKELFETEGHVGTITTYDTYEKQSKGEIGSSPNHYTTSEKINSYGLGTTIRIDHGDFFEFCNNPDKKFDLLYFDIDNDGDKLLEMYNGCKSNIEEGAVVIFEGGSTTRDNVDWMVSKNRTKMTESNVPYTLLTADEKYSCSIIYNTDKHKSGI